MAQISHIQLPRFDSRAPEVLEDPYSVYAGLRAAGPICRGGPAQWVVTRHADVSALLRDRRLSHQYPPEYHRLSVGEGAAADFFQRIILDRDPPDHTQLRQVMSAAFAPALLRRLSSYITEIVDELLDEALERSVFDAVNDIAFPLPVQVICETLGVPLADRSEVRPRAVDLAKGFSLVVAEEDRVTVHRAVTWLRDYIGALMNERRRRPQDDLISHMLAATRGAGSIGADEAIDNLIFLFFAGFETTTNLIATGCHALSRHPDQWHLLKRRPDLIATAVEEFLRFDAPIQATARLVREPIRVGEVTVRPGRLLVLLIGSANHDERAFTDPGVLDVARVPNPHVSFGGGLHHCLGSAVARIEAQAVFSRLLERAEDLVPAGAATRRPSATFRTFEKMPLSARRSLDPPLVARPPGTLT
jgi:cytochrome P450